MITMESWMFLSSFERMRQNIITNKTIRNMVHMPYLGKGGTSLGINFGTAAVVFDNHHINQYKAQYEFIRYYETNEEGIPFSFPTINERPPEGRKDDGTSFRVLVVDDSMFVAKQLGQILSSEGYEIVATAADGPKRLLRAGHRRRA